MIKIVLKEALKPTKRLTQATKVFSNEPLTQEELNDLPKANLWHMDACCDGRSIPPEVEKVFGGAESNGTAHGRQPTPAEARLLIDWVKRVAPGNFWF